MEKRSGFGKIGEVLGHAPNRAKQWEKAQISLFKVAIFGGEEEGELPRNKSLDLEQKELEKTAFGRRTMRR